MIYFLKKNKTIYQVILFCISGLIAGISYVLILFLAKEIFFLSNNSSITAGFIVSSYISFICLKHLTFNSKKTQYIELPKYISLLFLIYLLTIFFTNTFTRIFFINLYESSIITIGLTSFIKFIISKIYVFKK